MEETEENLAKVGIGLNHIRNFSRLLKECYRGCDSISSSDFESALCILVEKIDRTIREFTEVEQVFEAD